MRIYQLKTASEFLDDPFIIGQNLSVEQLMQMYAEDVAKRFAAECVNEALGNKMEVSNALHSKIESKYRSIIWNEQQQEETIVQEQPQDLKEENHSSLEEVVKPSFSSEIISSKKIVFYAKLIKEYPRHKVGRIYFITKHHDNALYSGDHRGIGEGGFVGNVIDSHFEKSTVEEYQAQYDSEK